MGSVEDLVPIAHSLYVLLVSSGRLDTVKTHAASPLIRTVAKVRPAMIS